MTGRHDESSCRDDASVPSGDDDRCVGRRSYLKLAGATAGSVSLLGRAAGVQAARAGGAFSRRVDAVDAGCDPTGRTPSDGAFRRALAEDTLFTFPTGTYRFTEPQVVLGLDSLGLRGEGEVSFVVPAGFDGDLLTIAGGSELLFHGIDVDMTAAGATPGLRLGARDRLLIEDGENGYLYEPGVDGFRRALDRCLDAVEDHDRVREAARAAAKEREWDSVVARHERAIFGHAAANDPALRPTT